MLVQRKHIAYTDSSYTTIYWQGVVDVDVQCGESYSSAWSSGDAICYWKVEYSYTDLPLGSVITIDSVPYSVSGTGVVTHLVGKPTAGSFATGSLLCGSTSACEDNSDCPEGEKCLDGECVPCDEQQATHFQIRAEFEELVTLPDGSQTMYLLSSVYPIGSGVSNQIIQLAECNGVWYYPRIRFCNAAGVIKPYTGALSFYGYCNPDGSTAMWVNNFNVTEQSHLLGQKAQMDLHFATPLSIPRILVEFIEPSAVIYETDCSSVTPVDPPEIEPKEPDDDEIDDIEDDDPIDKIDDDEEDDEPTKPQDGLCVCEEYIGKQIARLSNAVTSAANLIKNQIWVGFDGLHTKLHQQIQYDRELQLFIQNQQKQILENQHQRLLEIRQSLDSLGSVVFDIKTAVEKGLVKDDTGLIDAFIDETGKTINSAVQDIEPVWIENEFNVKSHIVPQGDTPIDE